MREVYNNERLINSDGTFIFIPSTSFQTRVMKLYGLNSKGKNK